MNEFAGRLSHYCRFSLVELPETGAGRTRSGEAPKEEGQKLLKLLGPRDRLVALDERGERLDSVQLSQYVGRAQNQSWDLVFAVGGDEGLSEEVRGRADLVLSLSAMTLPHRLARLVLIEQLYRAFTLLRGEPYHRA